jgi:hypothetical protein
MSGCLKLGEDIEGLVGEGLWFTGLPWWETLSPIIDMCRRDAEVVGSM